MLEKKHHLNVFERYVKAERLIVVRVESTSNRGEHVSDNHRTTRRNRIFCDPYPFKVGIALAMTHRKNSSRLTECLMK